MRDRTIEESVPKGSAGPAALVSPEPKSMIASPTVRPIADNKLEIIADVEPLPLVPVTWMTGTSHCGSPSAVMSRRIAVRAETCQLLSEREGTAHQPTRPRASMTKAK